MGKFEKGVIKIVVAASALVLAGAIMAFPIMWLWNYSIVAAVTFAKPINHSIAYGIYVLTSVLGKAAVADFKDKSDN